MSLIPEDDDVLLRRIQPYESNKPYVCPGCNGIIPVGMGHVVAVPHDDPDDRRHWHHSCWEHRHRRSPTGK